MFLGVWFEHRERRVSTLANQPIDSHNITLFQPDSVYEGPGATAPPIAAALTWCICPVQCHRVPLGCAAHGSGMMINTAQISHSFLVLKLVSPGKVS